MKHQIATAFGRHSRKVWRAIVGASWSLPLRYVTFGAQLVAIKMVPGVEVSLPGGWVMVAGMTAGVLVGWSLRILDNLINEFVVFEWIKRFFVEANKGRGRGA